MSGPGEASARRLERARRAGDGGESSLLAGALGFAVGVALLPSALAAARAELAALLERALLRPAAPAFALADAAWLTARLALPIVLATAATCAVAMAVQTRGLALRTGDHPGHPPGALDRLLDGAVALLTLAVALALAVSATRSLHLAPIGAGLGAALALGAQSALTLLRAAAAALLAVGVVDATLRKALWRRRLRPSPDEAKQERREQVGEPQVRTALRRAARQK